MISAAVRRRQAKRFVAVAIGAPALALALVVGLLATVVADGWRGFLRAEMVLPVELRWEPDSPPSVDRCEGAIRAALRARFPRVETRAAKKELSQLAGYAAAVDLCERIAQNPDWQGALPPRIALAASGKADFYLKNPSPETAKIVGLSAAQVAFLGEILAADEARIVFNWRFLRGADSRYPALAGVGGALIGSALTLLVAFLAAFPLAAGGAVYLEELAAKNRFNNLLEAVINNLAAVPSIIFGLFGLQIFVNTLGLPLSTPLVGGLTLAAMTLPVIVISARSALRAVPDSIRQSALALGATPMQAVFHHVVPNAMGGILTGSIIGMARALGETAPLLMIGMVAFISKAPAGVTDFATALPVQIFLWADSPERPFIERTAAAIIVLLVFLLAMNLAATVLRRKLEVRW